MRYFKSNSIQRAQQLSAGIYSLMYQNGQEVSTTYLFGWLTSRNPEITEVILEIDEELECPIFVDDNFQAKVLQLKSMLSEETTEQETQALVNYLKTGKIKLINIIPSTAVEVDEGYLIENEFKNTQSPY
jgi:hypothetical protein